MFRELIHSREILERASGIKQKVTMFICARAMWSIWKARNDVVFNKKALNSPVALVYKTMMMVKSWHPLLKTKMKSLAEDMINLLAAKATTSM